MNNEKLHNLVDKLMDDVEKVKVPIYEDYELWPIQEKIFLKKIDYLLLAFQAEIRKEVNEYIFNVLPKAE